MIALFLLLVIAAIALGIVGVVAKGLLYLLIIGIVVFVGALTLAALRMRRRPPKRQHRLSPLTAACHAGSALGSRSGLQAARPAIPAPANCGRLAAPAPRAPGCLGPQSRR